MSNEIAVTESQATQLPAQLTPSEVLRQIASIQGLMSSAMKEGEHYGKIPGCGDKATLFKAGAEKIGFMFRLVPTYPRIETIEMTNGHRENRITCRISTNGGTVLAEGVGSCSTMESKYRWRQSERKCPACGKTTIIKGKEEYGGGWLCFAKKGGCGAKWPNGAKEIESQNLGRVENPDIADQYNTVLKMAKKRAYVDATISATAASDIFTQDVEDFAPDQSPPVVPSTPAPVAPAPVDPKVAARDAMLADMPETQPAPPAFELSDKQKAELVSALNVCGIKQETLKAWRKKHLGTDMTYGAYETIMRVLKSEPDAITSDREPLPF